MQVLAARGHRPHIGERMTKTQLRQEPDEREQGARRDEDGLLEAVVGDNVLRALGRPPGPHRLQVRRVFGDNYRVNVLVGPDPATLPIAHSYFISADGDGKILACCPAIARTY
jgi:hypothetical protein